MANTYVDYTATAGQTDFNFSFPFLEDSHVVVEVEGVNQALTTNYTIETSPAQKIVLSNPTTAIAGGELVRIKRVSDPSTNLVDFVNGSILTETELDRAYRHNRYLAEEAYDGVNSGLRELEGSTHYNANNKQIKNLADGTLATDAVNKGYVDTQIALTDTNLAGFYKSTHTGNGTDNVFTLSFTPQTTEAEAYIVSIDGLVQVPDTDYTIGATDITFNAIPANSAEICVVATAAASVATINEAQVTATASTTARNLADRFGDVINILDYGASTANSAADNTTAINSAVSAALSNGKALYIPTGIFECNSIEIDFSGAKHLKIFGQVGGRAGELQSSGVSCLHFSSLSGSQIGLNFSSASGAEYMGLYIQDLELRGPSLQAGANPSTNTTGLFISKGRDTVLDNVHITDFRTGLHATYGWSWHDMNCKIARCHVGAKFDYAGTFGLQAALHTKLRVNDCTYGVMQESTGHTYVDPWFEGQPATNDREMEYAVVIGSATGITEEITFIDGWWEQIQNYPIKIGYYDDGTGGNAVNLANSTQTIDDIRISTYGHWDSVGLDVGQKKIDINDSATNIEDQAVRIDGELSNWDWSMVNGDASKATSTFNFINHASNGQRLSQFTTSGSSAGKGTQGNCWAGQKVNIPDNTATNVLSFDVPNKECGALFRLDYVIIANSEQSMASGSVLLMLGRKAGYATQGSVGTPENTNLSLISGITMTTPVFAFSSFQALDTVETATETFNLKLTQDNSNNQSATFAWKIEELSSARQANFQANFITVSQA